MMGGWGWKMRGDCGGGRSGVVEEVQGRMMFAGECYSVLRAVLLLLGCLMRGGRDWP
jgi:hypothetical protein